MSPRLRSILASRRWTTEDAHEVIAALERSGQPVSLFASEHGLDAQRLYLWRRRLGKAEAITFQELVVRPEERTALRVGDEAGERVEVVLPCGVVLRVAETIDAKVLRRLVGALSDTSPC
jgi:transposase-like protein